MKRIYIAANLPDAQVMVDMLDAQGIRAHIFNAYSISGAGELAAHQWPEVWVEDDAQSENAFSLIRQINETSLTPEKTCPNCGESNPGNFLSCWNCLRSLAREQP
jgi:hypothetical protein